MNIINITPYPLELVIMIIPRKFICLQKRKTANEVIVPSVIMLNNEKWKLTTSPTGVFAFHIIELKKNDEQVTLWLESKMEQ